MLIIKTFGGITVEKDGAACTGAAAQRKHLALLALLAAAGHRGVSREKLVAYLWPERDTDGARHLLSQACYALRQELDQPELFVGTTEVLRLNPAVISSDIESFEDAFEQGDVARAVTLYEGPFLDGFYLGEAAEFERWTETERARLAKRACEGLRTLAAGSASRGDQRAAIEWWRRLVALDPLSADSVLGLMKALATAGERAQAVHHGRAYSALVRQELDTAPASAVTHLIEQLRQQSSGAREPLSQEPREPARAAAPSATAAPGLPRRALAMGATIVAAATLAALAFGISRREPVPAPTSIAVLYFDNLSSDTNDAYFADGLTEELVAQLGQIGGLAVKSRSAVRPYRGATGGDPASLGRTLEVAHLVAGSVRRAGGRLRVTVELVEASTGDRLWGALYNPRDTNLIVIQEDIARAVTTAVRDRLLR